jgi:hypothetical protein
VSEATLTYIHTIVLTAALSMLPRKMDTPPARAQLIATGLQESRFEHRRQMGGGPALSFWQGEPGGGMHLIDDHPSTRDLVLDVLQRMGYDEPSLGAFTAIEHNDILACVRARLLLWTHSGPLPRDAAGAWAYYIATWNPGKPKPETWHAFYARAWALVEAA